MKAWPFAGYCKWMFEQGSLGVSPLPFSFPGTPSPGFSLKSCIQKGYLSKSCIQMGYGQTIVFKQVRLSFGGWALSVLLPV